MWKCAVEGRNPREIVCGLLLASRLSSADAAGETGYHFASGSHIAPSVLPAPKMAIPAATNILNRLRVPLSVFAVSSPFGMRTNPVYKVAIFHRGVDLAAPDGMPIHAAEDGAVVEMEGHGHYGFYVRINHGHGVETAYGHLLRFMPGLHKGSVLRRGDVIGFVGATGLATGSHLHYEVLVNGQPIDPLRAVATSSAPLALRGATSENP